MYSRPAASQTRHPAARTMRSGTAGPSPGPNSASGRLLPVDVKPGTRQSLTVFHHLDRHGPEQLHFAFVQRDAMNHLPQRAHDVLRVAGLEELDRPERALDVGEEALQLRPRGGRRSPPRQLERGCPVRAGEGELVQHHHHRVRQVQRRVRRVRGNRHDPMATVQRGVGEPLVFPAEQQRHGPGLGYACDLGGGFARPLHVAFRGPAARREADDVHAVAQGSLEPVAQPHARQHVLCLVRDALDPERVVLPRRDEAQVAATEVLHRANDVRDVDELLGLVEDDDDGRSDGRTVGQRSLESFRPTVRRSDRPTLHPTSSSTPNRSGLWRSPHSQTQPFPPLHTSCPARRSRPGSISLTSRSNPSRPPACARTCSEKASASVTRYPCSVRAQAPRTRSGRAAVPPTACTRTPPPSTPSGTIKNPRTSPCSPSSRYSCSPSECMSSGSLSSPSGDASGGRKHRSAFVTSAATYSASSVQLT